MEKQQSLSAASFDTAAMPVAAAAAATSFRRPDWILLDKVACLADRPNGTTARCVTPICGHAVEVSFWLADPPGLSQMCVHCPGLEESESVLESTVLCSEKNVVVLQIYFSFGPKLHAGDPGHREYFVYEADPDHPSLRPLPIPYLLARLPFAYGFGLLPSIDGGFSIAVLRPQKLLSIDGAFDLYIFSSKTWAWSTKTARLGPQSPMPKSPCLMHQTDKVITLQADTLGFVDLWRGILCCRVIDDDSPDLLLRFIPLPPPMENNNWSEGMRDVTCINGVIKFLEIAHRKRLVVRERSHAPRHKTCILHDSELLELMANRAGSTTGTKDVCHYVYDGWNAVTWNRLTGSDHWLLDCEIDVDDVTVSNPEHIALLPGLTSSDPARSTTLNRNLRTSDPAFGMHNGDVVYLACKVDKTSCILEINTRMRRLENLAPFSAERTRHFSQAYNRCALSKHMDMVMTPRKRKERDDAKNVPTDRTILVHGLDPCLTEDELRKIFTMFGELRGLNIHANHQYASVKFVRRACGEKAIRLLSGGQFGREKLALSWETNGPNIQLPEPTRGPGQSLDTQTGTGRFHQSRGYYRPQLKPPGPPPPPPGPPPYYSHSSSHQEVAENKKPRLDVGT